MAKRNESIWQAETREQSLDGMFGAMRDEACKRLQRTDISVGAEVEQLLIGLYLPALSLRYLFQSTVLPLGRVLQVTGEEGSCKSAFGYEIMRWHFMYGGGAVHIENENKDSPELRNSILTWQPQWLQRLEFIQTYTLEQWQQALTTFLSIGQAYLDAPDGPGHTIPICYLLDSLMATLPEQVLKKIMKEGNAALGYPVAARLISEYMRSVAAQLEQYPFTIVCTNHLKPGQDDMGRPTYAVPGGKSVRFMETYEIMMSKTGSADIDLRDYGGIRVRLRAEKNSLGPSRKQIVAELLWWLREDADGVMRQHTEWDWHTASIMLLLSFNETSGRQNGFGVRGKKDLFDSLQDICHIVVTDGSHRQAKCKDLGITEPVSYHELGLALERHPDILAAMYPLLGIARRREYQAGMNYRQMRQSMAAESQQVAAQAPPATAFSAPPAAPRTLYTDSDDDMVEDE